MSLKCRKSPCFPFSFGSAFLSPEYKPMNESETRGSEGGWSRVYIRAALPAAFHASSMCSSVQWRRLSPLWGSVASFPGAHKRWLGEGRLQKWPEGGFWSFFPVWSFKTNSFSFSSALLTLEKQFWFYRKPQAKWMVLKPHTFLAVLRAVLKGPQV